MPTSYQLRDTATRQLLARDLAELEEDLQRNGEGAGRIRLRLDVEKVTDGVPESVGHHVLLLGVDDVPGLLPAF
ncbi:hypothetical protein ACQEV2_42170 [Streptomyces sp. CA-251387]|uniref:hypothetical protein n=1 Tax=Streptomyces sp. CA-251387 TaxID=3240064 RepID=UPI003D8CF1AC